VKRTYLAELKELLNDLEMSSTERNDILLDYARMYDDGLERGLDDAGVIDRLGTPEKVADALRDEYHSLPKHQKDGRIVALMPFLSVIAYFILGYYYDLWSTGWLVFLSIPMVAILSSAIRGRKRHLLTALSPFIATVTYLGIGFGLDTWHPTWLIFLIIPVIAILNSFKAYDVIGRGKGILEQITALSVFIAITVFVLLGTYQGLWNPGWLVFLIIPMLGILTDKSLIKKVLFELCFIIAIAFYLYVGYTYGEWWFGALGFLLPFGFGVMTQDIKISFTPGGILLKVIILLAIVLYFAGGILLDAWGYLWMVFLLIPMVAIVKNGPKKHHIVALSPFIATIIFYSLGYFFGLWEISWLAFLLIPITGILVKG